MQRGKIYLGILVVMLVLAQFVQMKEGPKFIFDHSTISTSNHAKAYLGKNDLLHNDNISPLVKDDHFYAFKNDQYLLKDTLHQTVQYFKVLTDSPPQKDSIRFQTTYLEYKNYEFLNFIDFIKKENWEDSVTIQHLKLQVLAKKDFKQTIKTAHSVRSAVGMAHQIEPKLDWFTLFFYSPYFALFLLLAYLVGLWGIDKLSSWLATYFNRPKWTVLFLPFLALTLWNTFQISEHYYSNLQVKDLPWPHWLTAQIVVSLAFLPFFILFFYLKKHYFDKWNLVDREVGKFIYIFVLLTAGNYLHSYFGSQILQYLNPPHPNSTIVWQTGEIPAYALLFATANLLNNLRKRYYTLKSKEKALGIAQKNELQSQASLAALQSKINPHFLYNALNSIASLAKDDPEKTEKMTIALSKFYKYSTNREDALWSTIQEEISIIESYLAIETIRFGEQLSLTLNCEDSLKSIPIPHFLLQPIVENAIKYGYNDKEEKISVTINLERKDEDIIISILDTGTPFSENMQLGYGLKNVQQKLKLLYPEKHQIEFSNVPQKGIFITLDT